MCAPPAAATYETWRTGTSAGCASTGRAWRTPWGSSPRCCVSTVASSRVPFELQPAQAFIVGSLFGWVREDGTRRFRVAYIEMGKGNGKSPMIGGIGLYGMVADNEPRAEIYAAATKKDQAMILFRDAVAMVDQSPALLRRLKKSGRDDKVWNLFDDRSNSFFRPISADDGQSGPRPHMGLIDELHEHKSPTVINMMSAGRKWRRQPLIVAITNSGTDRKSVCWEYREKGIKVCEGVDQDDTLFAYVCALDEGDDPFLSEDCWIKANPLLGTIIDPQYLRDEVNAARGMPSKESTVRRLNFCEWVEAYNPAISYEKWMAAKAEYTLEKFRGKRATLGLDLSATTDLTAAVLDVKIDGVHWLWPWFFIPADGLAARSRKDGVPYDTWVKRGSCRRRPAAPSTRTSSWTTSRSSWPSSTSPWKRRHTTATVSTCSRLHARAKA